MKKLVFIVLALIIIFITVTYFSVSENEDTFRTCSILDIENIDNINFKDFDSVTVAANTLYNASVLKEFMQGEQYRDAWAASVTVPIVFLDTLNGGLRIIEEGGGKQTHSLELEDNQGIRYALRSLSKNPEKLVPKIAETLNLENIIIDGISAQHPYAALVASKLSEGAGILHTNPKLMFIPQQKLLKKLNDKYGNRLYYFEYESEGKENWTSLDHIKELLDTDDLIKLRSELGEKVTINHNALIRARLFDLLIGDWDRHAKQWGWALQKKKDTYTATPIPTDRDNAFFNLEGVLPTLITNNKILPEVQPFDTKIEFLPGLIHEFDEYFLQSTTIEQFRTEAMALKNSFTDKMIEEAFKHWPKAIDSLDGQEIREKIKSRRDDLFTYAEDFYNIMNNRPKKRIVLKGCEDLEISDELSICFDCFDDN